eukprot:3368897-Karenia_brevis.AAC.1
MATAKSPKALNAAILTILECVSSAFHEYVGRGAIDARRRLVQDGGLIKLPDSIRHCVDGATHLRIVDSYKHLGSYIGLDALHNQDVIHRCSSAMAAYVPLSGT